MLRQLQRKKQKLLTNGASSGDDDVSRRNDPSVVVDAAAVPSADASVAPLDAPLTSPDLPQPAALASQADGDDVIAHCQNEDPCIQNGLTVTTAHGNETCSKNDVTGTTRDTLMESIERVANNTATPPRDVSLSQATDDSSLHDSQLVGLTGAHCKCS